MAAGTGIGEFFVSLTVDAAEGALTVDSLVQGLGNLEIATIAEIGLLWEMATQLAKVTDEGLKASLGFAQFTMHTGLSAQELQKWQIVAQQSHAAASDVTGSVENLTKKLADMGVGGTGGGALGALQQLFISPFGPGNKPKEAFQILDEVRHKLGLIKDAGQQERILANLGISPNLRETLLLSDALFRERGNIVPGMSKEQEAQFDHLRQTMVEIELRTKQIGVNIGAWLSPAVQKVFDVLNFVASAELKGGGAWIDAWHRAMAAEEREKKGGRPFEFRESVLGQIIYGVQPPASPMRSNYVTVDKHDTYVIQDAHNPEKVKEVIERHWDETLQKKTVDGFDRQLNNGGY